MRGCQYRATFAHASARRLAATSKRHVPVRGATMRARISRIHSLRCACEFMTNSQVRAGLLNSMPNGRVASNHATAEQPSRITTLSLGSASVAVRYTLNTRPRRRRTFGPHCFSIAFLLRFMRTSSSLDPSTSTPSYFSSAAVAPASVLDEPPSVDSGPPPAPGPAVAPDPAPEPAPAPALGADARASTSTSEMGSASACRARTQASRQAC